MKLQDTKSTYKNQWHFNTLTRNYLQKKLKKKTHFVYNSIKKNEIFRKKFKWEDKGQYSENSSGLKS